MARSARAVWPLSYDCQPFLSLAPGRHLGPPLCRGATARDAARQLDGNLHDGDGTSVRSHQHAAGAHPGGAEAEALGRSQGCFRTQVHLRAEGGGKLMTLVLTPGQRPEAVAFEAMLEGGPVKRSGGGRLIVVAFRGPRDSRQERPHLLAQRHGWFLPIEHWDRRILQQRRDLQDLVHMRDQLPTGLGGNAPPLPPRRLQRVFFSACRPGSSLIASTLSKATA